MGGGGVLGFLIWALITRWGAAFMFNPDEPLFLSPMIREGDIRKAKFLSHVNPLPDSCSARRSYSGFITISEEYNSNLFFWFIPAQEDPDTAPVILFLDGGPGISSMYALFLQNGPYTFGKDEKLTSRKFDWTKKYSLLYVDQPVGTGFSFTDNDLGYVTNMDEVGRDMYNFLVQFFTLFPDFSHQDFYLGGESYAGKYIPAISYKIHVENPGAEMKMNLKGFFIGGPFTEPLKVFTECTEYYYNLGLMNRKETETFKTLNENIVKLVERNELEKAGEAPLNLYFGRNSYVYKKTGYDSINNVEHTQNSPEVNLFTSFLSRLDTRQAIHVGSNITFETSPKLIQYLMKDISIDAKKYLIDLLNSQQYKIMIFSGQLDLVICAPSIIAMIDGLDTWTDIEAYRTAEKKTWRLRPNETDVAGYVTSYGNFKYVVIRGAGHYAPTDQPERSFDMVTRFIEDKPFY